MIFNSSTPRDVRSDLRRGLRAGLHKLYVVAPRHSGKSGWRFGILVGNVMHVLPEIVKDSLTGREISTARFGVRAVEYRPKAKAKLAQAA